MDTFSLGNVKFSTGSKEISDQARYMHKADEMSERMLLIVYRYYVINNGPSFPPRTIVNITVPLRKDDQVVAIIRSCVDYVCDTIQCTIENLRKFEQEIINVTIDIVQKVIAKEKKWTTLSVEPATVVEEINIWIIIGSVLGALALLIIVIVILWRCGFFKRKKHIEVQQWKQESLYKRRSHPGAANSSPTAR